jgi:prefoldin subunit 5
LKVGGFMANLSSLGSSLAYWNRQVNAVNDKIRKLKKRQSDVEVVKKNLRSTANSNSSEINDKLHSASSKFDYAIYYSGKDSQLRVILEGKNEHTIGQDSDLTASHGELQRELNDIARKIAEAERELAASKRKVTDLKAAIAMEERLRR